ncbi:hypothetical protein M0R88_10725 [Halorussus gelatinilyticus]|uniref:Uncharacterized protein n=1 Tax=Halorussus gelatinilyticus TaxID=2937524 RepID=A0A8U0IE80_9EURY|nr:hypothetical protein [Halorussus gelatinilyticus]UPV99000.1 hypothetical protein M0R88_10725 [Halorussus gelatinilyticus]
MHSITKADGGVAGVVSNSSSSYAVGGGRFAVGADRLTLLVVLVVGKMLDAVSTVTVLSLRDDVYESMWLTRTLMDEFGMVEGVLVTVVLAVVGVALLAESGEVVARLVPDAWAPDGYPAAFRVVTYSSAAVWYGFLGVHNFMFLF